MMLAIGPMPVCVRCQISCVDSRVSQPQKLHTCIPNLELSWHICQLQRTTSLIDIEVPTSQVFTTENTICLIDLKLSENKDL